MTSPQYNDEIDELLNELNNSLAIADHYDTTEDRTYELQAISKAKQRLQTLIKQAEVRGEINSLREVVPAILKIYYPRLDKNTKALISARLSDLEAQLNNLERDKR